jgi:hypothetical protein
MGNGRQKAADNGKAGPENRPLKTSIADTPADNGAVFLFNKMGSLGLLF